MIIINIAFAAFILYLAGVALLRLYANTLTDEQIVTGDYDMPTWAVWTAIGVGVAKWVTIVATLAAIVITLGRVF